MQPAWSLKLPERGPDRLIRLLVGGLADYRGRSLEMLERLGERIGPERPLPVPEMRPLVSVGVADVGEVDVERRSRLDGDVGGGERLRERPDIGEGAVGYGVEVREVEYGPDPVEPSGDGKDVVQRAELVDTSHDLDSERHRPVLALQPLPNFGELVDDGVDRGRVVAPEQIARVDHHDLRPALHRDAGGVVEHPDRHPVLLVLLRPPDDGEQGSVHRQDDSRLARKLAEAPGEVPIHPELALEVDLAGVIATLTQQLDGLLGRLPGGQVGGTEAQCAHGPQSRSRPYPRCAARTCRAAFDEVNAGQISAPLAALPVGTEAKGSRRTLGAETLCRRLTARAAVPPLTLRTSMPRFMSNR